MTVVRSHISRNTLRTYTGEREGGREREDAGEMGRESSKRESISKVGE